MKIIFISLLLFIFTLIVKSKKEIEVQEDFTAEIEYRLENRDDSWKKRGHINFLQKNNNKNYKSNVYVVNDAINSKELEQIKNECEESGLYLVRVKTNSKTFYSSVNSCLLVKNNFRDRFVINYFGSIKNDQIISINYDIDLINGQGEVTKTKNYSTSVDFVTTVASSGPNFPEEKEEDKTKQPEAEPSFLQKYWWIILIVLLVSSLKAPAEEGQAAS